MSLTFKDLHLILEKLLNSKNLVTSDPYDIWKTKSGFFIKKGYYKNKIIFLPQAIVFSIFDVFINNSMRLFYKEQEYPIVRAQFALTLINLYKITNNKEIIIQIKHNLEWLLQNHIKTENGIGWGINFKLAISKNLTYPSDTPYSTITPYVLEAFYQYRILTGDNSYDKIFERIYGFLYKDLVIMLEKDNLLALSYGPIRDRVVVNANSYILYAYSMLYNLMPQKKDELKHRIYGIYNFIKQSQQNDGAWLYSMSDTKTFIDCFHSCFVLKNLIKTRKSLNFEIEGVEKIIKAGYDYILENFKDENNLLKHFTLANRQSLSKYDLYDSAEFLNVASLINDQKNAVLTLEAIGEYFIEDQIIYSNIDIFNKKRNPHMLRWAIMPLLLAASNYYSNSHASQT